MDLARACFKFFLFFLLCAFVIIVQTAVLLVHQGKYARIIPYFWMNSARRIFGIRLRVHGTPYHATQTLYVSNHLSYLDIPVIGSVLKVPFVSRKDASEWPFLGYLVKLGQTAYVERSRSALKNDAHSLTGVIDRGGSLVIFPEGTSTDGQNVLPFKSSLFSLAIRDDKPDLHIQPISLKMTHVDGHTPQTQDDRDLYAWHRGIDTELFAHLWRFAKTRGAEIHLTFHPAIRAAEYSDRKILAKTCYDTVSNGVAQRRLAA
ncbi:MAG: lysophospholipid acyltransferase family protein [Bdellovibrionales bacterium]